MANNCSLKFNETKVGTNLKAEVGNNDVLFNSLMSAVIDGSRPSGFNKEFETYYSNNYGSIPNTNDESKEVATAIQNFYKNRNFNVNEHTTDSAFISDVKSKGYTSTAAKTCGIRMAANQMLMFYHDDLIKGRLDEHADDRKNNLADRVINRMLSGVAVGILINRKTKPTPAEIDKIRKQLMNIDGNDFINLEDEVSKATPQLRNQFATLKDMLSDKVKYFTQVIQTDQRLGEIRFKKDDDLSQQEADWSESFDIEDDEALNLDDAADNASNNEKDTTTARWEDNGTKSDFMKDFSFAVRSYLSTIPKLSSAEVSADGKYQYDKSNPLGMVDYMDFKVVNSAIRGDIETTNIDVFLKKLEDIAESNKEYAGLAYLANDLRKKPDFAYKVFQVYRRRTIRKQQVRIDDTSVAPTRSNTRADKLETLRINYLNDIKSTALNIMIEDTNEILEEIKTKIKDYKVLQKTKGFDLNKEALNADIINAIASRLKQYYPSLDKAAIERFARLNGKVDGKAPNIANNLTQLYGYLDNTAKYANETLSNKKYLDNRFKEVNKIEDKKARKEALDSVREAYKQGYLSTNTKTYALELAKALAPYSVVNIDSNSTNALGNQSADQINDSMITNFLNAVKATLTEEQKDGTKVSTELINYGKYKFQGVQYNLSGILMEHRNENGAIINYGLFYKDKDGNIQITNYARDMINISLFDGAGNPNTKDNVLYSGMSKGDYVYTGFAQYFNAEQNPNMLMGDYFMRIPSDAPKNFVVHAPRYKVDGLFSKMHAIRNAKGEVIGKEVSVDDINENHPIVQQFRNIFKQELLNMVNFINIVFEVKENTETLEDGTVVDKRGRIVFNNNNTPMFKKGWGLDAESARRVFANYHIGKGHKHFIEKKGDGWAFNGLLFKDDRFVLTDYKTGTTTKYGDDLLKHLFPSLYGGARDGFIPFTTNANGEVELNLTADQEAMITRMVKGFVTDYSNNAIARMSEYKDLDINNLINEKNSIDFALNHRLMYIAFNDVFEGDTKFYKDTQTFLKRSKESQASGVPYGFVDTSLDLRENSAIVQGAFLNTPEVQARLKAIGLDVQQKTKFNGITIKNTVRTSEECKVAKTYPDGRVEGEDGILVKDLVKNAKLTLEQARDLMGGPILYKPDGTPELNKDKSCRRSGGFSNTTVNDAQSYITFEEWIRRIAGRGQLNDYLPLIEAIQDESKEIPADLLKKFVQVQKNFYYDQYYDEKLNTIAPRQIKNAEFVLVPRFIRGTQLEQVYNAMKDNNIDQLNTEETSKAGKARVLTIFDEKTGEVTEEHLKDFNNKAEDYREEYDYNHLYTQQETPQHMNAKNKAGIQIMKKILDNIDRNSPLYAYKEDFFNMYVANIKDSFNSLVDELKIPLDKDGNIKFDEAGNITGVDMQVFFDKLKDECMRLGLDSNMMDFVTLNASMPIAPNGCPNPVMPTYLSNVINKLESISQAMFNSAITRQELPGFHAAQITNVGFKATKDQVSYSKELKYHPNGERYIEIMLPKSNFGFAKNTDGTYKDVDEVRDKDGNLIGGLLKQLQDAHLDTLIGYRIPTEGKQSVCVMKVVGFLDDAQGSTIVVPDDWVSQTGSDFDIDSVYGIQYNTTINANGDIQKVLYNDLAGKSYDDYVKSQLNSEAKAKLKKAIKEGVNETTALNNVATEYGLQSREEFSKDKNLADENSREARNNRLLDDMIHILQANESLEENLSRSNFESIIAARDKVMNPIVKEIREARSPYDFFDQAAYQEDVMSGLKLKAFSVTRDTFCSVCNTVRPRIADNYVVKIAYSKDKYNLKELQKRFEKVEETDEGYVVTHNTLGWTNDNKNVDGYILTAYSSQTTAHILDAVKEGAIPNVNDFTFAVYKTLVDIGSNYDTAVGFIMQPAITRIVNAYNANKSIYSDKHNKPIEEAIASLGKEILNAYHIKTDKMNLNDIVARVNALLGVKYSLDKHNDITLSPDELAKRLLNDKNRPVKRSVYQHDWAVLFAYNDLSKLSNKIGDTARVCNPDRFGAKQSIFATRKVFNDIADLIEDENPALVVGTSSIVNSIYAGYDPNKGLRSYITSDAKSAYPSLNAFLKYASAPSILVNRMLFDTEQDNFRIANRAIEVINGSNNVTEKDYKGFTQYILNTAYKQTDAVVCNYTYDVEKKQTVVNKEVDETDEALRIMGYGCTPDFTFNVKDVTNPTQEEVDAWSKLSPAQKISWLKANSVDVGIFNYINTNLFNEYEMNRDGQSRQTIRFNEDAVDNETAYNLFDTAFRSDNPLVKLAAMDMIKYAFVAEGFKIGRGAINKCIKNTALRDENTFVQYNGSRTSIVAQIKAQVDNAVARTDLIEQYLRTDPGVTNVPHKFMNKKYSSMFKTVTRGMYEFSLNDKNNAIEFGFARESNSKVVPIQFNDYIYITKKEDNESVTKLYKIVSPAPGISFAYPLNSLEAGEDREVSINNANNSVPLPSYYEAVIENLMSDDTDYTLPELNELYKHHIATTKVNKVKAVTHFDIMQDANNDNGGAKDAINKIIKTFNNYEGNRIFIQNMYLYDRIKYNSFTTPIHVEGETISNDGEPISINGNFLFRRATKVSIESHNIRTGEHIEEKPQLVEIVRETPMASSREEVTLGSASSKLEQSLRTTTDSFEKNIVKELNRRSGLGDIEAGKLMRQLRGEGFEQSTKGYKEFKDSVFYSGYAYLKHKVNSTLGKFNQFYRDENGNYFAINSPEVIEAIKNNPALQRQFLEALADANAIIDKFGIINQIKADEIENPTLKFYIEEMQNMIKELSNTSVIDDAEVKFGIDYLQKLSNDPNIQNGIVSIWDGFHSSGWLDAWFGDLQEQGNSLVQIVTRKVMADIHAKESQAKDFAVSFGKHFEDIKARAAKVGASVDLNKIFDKNGNIVRNYTDKFVEDIKELKRNVAKARVNVQENPMEYIQAKHKLDKFLLDHVNREYVDSYYQKLYNEDEFIINNHPQIYSEYVKLREAIRQINSRRIDGVLSKEFEDKLVELRTKINDLTSQFIGNDYKPAYENGFPGTEKAPDDSIIITNQEVYDNARKQSLNDAIQLDQYLRRIKDIKEEYTAKEEKEGFRDMLDKMLNIIDNAEVRDSNGKVTTPASQLDTNKEYKKAKEWIANNAHWSVDDTIKVQIEDAYKKLGIASGKASEARRLIKEKLAKGEQIYDEFGNIDASKFTNTEIAKIKEDVERNYGTTNTSLFSDRNLINSAEPTNEAAPSEFFKMLNSGGMSNPEYQKIITKINNITRKYYNSAAKIVETSKMSIEDLKALGDLYDELDKTKKHKGKGSYYAYQSYSKYAKENVNEQAYYSEEDEAKKRTEPEFYTLWKRVNSRYEVLRDKKGKIVIDETTGKAVYDLTKAPKPNHWLYTTIAPNDDYWKDLNKRDPKEAARQKKEVEDKTKAQEFLSNTLETINTPQYYKAKNAALAKGNAYYKEWYDNNHVYNPFTHAYEALPIWNRTRVIPSIDNGEYSPNWTQTTLTPKANYKNPNYIEGYTDNENYKTVETDDKNGTTHVPGYDNNLGLNEYEQEAKQYIQDTLMQFAKTETAKRAIASGMAPHRAKKAEHDAKWAAKQAKEFIGFSDMLPSGKDSWYEKIDYSEDRTIDMPMLMTQLKNKESVDLDNIRSTKPKRETYTSDEAYEKDLEAYQKRMDEATKKNEEIHQKLLDKDYIGAIQDFISAAGHYNAIQDNKQLLFYTHRMLSKMKAYDTNLGWNNLRKDSQTSTSDETSYIEKADTRLQEQFDNWVRRLVYDQYKIPQNKLTRNASMLQSFTSAKFMMLNFTGAIGNITIGESAIAGEYIAKEYFTPTGWLKGKNMWRQAVPSFIRGMANEDSTTLADALVKFMNIVDFDEVNNRPTVHLDADTILNKIRDFMYSPNSMGEHFMQNGAMFSMFFDNRMVKVPDAESNGRLGYEAMTWEQYKNKFHEYAMKNIIGGNEELLNKYEEFKNNILADDNKKKEYIWNRRDINTEFANLYLTKEQKKQFIAERKKLEKEAKVKFEELPTVMDQLDLKDGRLAFKEGSILAEFQAKSQDKEVGDGYMFLGYMKGKVISVNKKIHGVYDKLGAAQLEKQWWGSLAMQYHKHIYPGVMKHYRRKGYFNEERGTKEIGCAPALFDFLTTPIRQLRYEKEMSDGQVEALESLQVLLKGYAEFAMNLQTNWQLMPKWQRASIERAAGDVVGALGGVCTALAVRCIWDDDDLKNSLWGNLMLYEADDLTTQSMMYNMLFLPQQFDQLWSSPIAGITAGKDIMAACNNIAAYVMDDDYDPNYTSGRYAGQNKILVKLGRQIPIYRSLNNLATLDKANSYYKTGDNLLTLINVKDWANDIRGTSSLER